MSQAAQDLNDGETPRIPEKFKLTNTNTHMNARGAVDETREHQFNEKRLVSSSARPHEPRRCV